MSKYGAKKVKYNGIVFDSKKECNRYCELRLLERAGKIQGLEMQKTFELIPSQRINGKVVERPVTYKADFTYTENGKRVIEDTKGFKTKDYIIKRKLMLYIHGIKIVEI